MQINALSFSKLNQLAVGVSTRVDIYSLAQPESAEDVEFEKLKP